MTGRARWQKPALFIAAALFVIAAGVGVVYLIRGMLAGQSGPVKQIVQQVQIVRPPPPPPDTPPPPPPEAQEEVDIPEPQDTPQPSDDAPPAEQLGLDAEGGAGGDGFGLLGRKGGRDLLATSGSAFGWYTNLLKTQILERLQDDKKVRSSAYKVTVRVWLQQDGTVERVELADSTGNRELDGAIRQALTGLKRLSQAPPIEMPQPVNLQIVSRI